MQTLGEAARAVLLTADPHDKRRAARGLARAWRRGQLEHRCDTPMPDQPAWPAEPELLAPNRMPKRGKGGSERGRIALLDRRLRQLGSHYGALPAHAGLWEAAEATADDALARLAIVPMVLEARGLDVTPATVERFQAAGDEASAKILSRIYKDEIRHVRVGTLWFRQKCDETGFNAVETWHALVKSRFRGSLKPPFNDSARQRAGLTQEFYAVIAS